MNLITLKQFATEQGITYEAVRKQVVKYSEQLSGHIIKKSRVQYLDEQAVDFLKGKRRESPVVLVTETQSEEITKLKDQVDTLKNQLLATQQDLLKAKDQVIALQDESRKVLEDRGKYEALAQENEIKSSELKQLRIKNKELLQDRDKAVDEAQSYHKSIFGFYRKK